MNGLHCVADFQGCHRERLADSQGLLVQCEQSVLNAGLGVVARLAHQFDAHPAHPHLPGGVTLTLLLAESHLCLHTWPEIGAVTLDVYVCNFLGDNSAKARYVMDALIDWLQPQQTTRQEILRGQIASP